MRQFGLIGFPLSHSFSKKYFDEKFLNEGITDASFELFSIERIELFTNILQSHQHLYGIAITIPYKKSVIDFLDEQDEVVRKINACNCIKFKNGKLFGFNTDVIGFERSFIQQLQPKHKQALILGTGGAAVAIEYVLQKLNIAYKFVSRKKESNHFSYNELNADILSEYQIIINTSPLGTFPNVDEAPQLPYQFITLQHYLFDLVYNPAETKFLRSGKEKGATIQNGYDMLVLQAEENWKIWNS